MEKLTLAINGMSCGHCVARVQQTLAAMPGVQVNDVAIGSASLALRCVRDDDLRDDRDGSVSAAGYPARAANAAERRR